MKKRLILLSTFFLLSATSIYSNTFNYVINDTNLKPTYVEKAPLYREYCFNEETNINRQSSN